MPEPLPPRYDPHEVEARLYPAWESRGDFRADASRVKSNGGTRDPFVVMIPPPNVTGALHMGHALNNTLQDLLCRWRRMCGDEVLWLPGTDHAGIATQAVVERKLFEERRVRRLDMGREAFVAEVAAWREKYGGTILQQLRRLGCSCDWSRTKYTMDPDLSVAVRRAFVDLFREGLVYRGARIVNWDCALETAVSDDEIEYEERRGHLWHIRYPRCDGQGAVVVATTRPETMLGDTGVAVHPDDPRYRDLVGAKVRLPLLGREIPVVADASVDPAFGTGAVKVTPGHDPQDYERGRRHGLPVVIVFDPRGRITAEGGPYAGLSREQARDRVLADLEAQGLLEKVEDHALRVAVSERSRSVIEPLVSEQWFVRMEALAGPAIAAVKDGTLKFRPERWTKVYLDWLENVRDWCISRQLWWGHRIPVWYDGDGAPAALLEDPAPGALHPTTGKPLVRQDEDVLDTWASSWLWPLSTLGWPDADAEDLRTLYPTQVLSTAREIIYLWVARMVMAGYRFADHLPPERRCPFSTVYIHATILDGRGRRMSKSAGNGIDPVDMIAKWGADAVRFTLVDLTTEGQDVRLAENRFEVGRNFMNKLWNAGRFVAENTKYTGKNHRLYSDADKAILGKLAMLMAEVDDCLNTYRFHDYARVMYRFVWNDFCDWYLEIRKDAIKGIQHPETQETIRRVFLAVLRLLNPICPFITEELFARIGFHASECGVEVDALSRLAWPTADGLERDVPAEQRDAALRGMVQAVRQIRQEFQIPWDAEIPLVALKVPANLDPSDSDLANFRRLAGLLREGRVSVGQNPEKPPHSATVVLDQGIEVYVPLAGLIDLDAEKARLGREIEKAQGLRDSIQRKLGNADFVARAKPEVVESERARLAEAEALLSRLRSALGGLG